MEPILNEGVGRDGEIRTLDPTHPKGVRYRAAPRPEKTDQRQKTTDYRPFSDSNFRPLSVVFGLQSIVHGLN